MDKAEGGHGCGQWHVYGHEHRQDVGRVQAQTQTGWGQGGGMNMGGTQARTWAGHGWGTGGTQDTGGMRGQSWGRTWMWMQAHT